MGEAYIQPFVKKSHYYFSKYKEKFMLLGSLKWPDGSFILVFKKITAAAGEVR